MLKSLLQFAEFYTSADTIYQVHSPYLYEIVDKTIENPDLGHNRLQEIIKKKKSAANDHRTFEVMDFGARSRVQTELQERTISDFSKMSSSGSRILAFLYHLSRISEPRNTIELGTGLGFASAALSLGHPESSTISIEGNPHLAVYTQEYLNSYPATTNLMTDRIENVLEQLDKEIRWDIVFNDGNHTYDAAIEYFDFFKNKMSPKGIFIMDDIRWSPGMKKAWDELIQRPEVMSSIDLFTLGILFFNSDLKEKHNFKIIPSPYKPWKKFAF